MPSDLEKLAHLVRELGSATSPHRERVARGSLNASKMSSGVPTGVPAARQAASALQQAGRKLAEASSALDEFAAGAERFAARLDGGGGAQGTPIGDSLGGHRSRPAGVPGAGSDGAGAPPVTAAGELAAMGLANVDVSLANLAENPILDDGGEQGTFGKGGLARSDYRWLVRTWRDTLAPGLAAGMTRDDFAVLDAQSSAPPLRRLADVYDIFLGTNRILVDRLPDGSLVITNGRHRLLIAKELGIDSLPGQVS